MDKRTRTIAPNVEMPLLGFGTYLIPNGEVAAAVRTALEAGYRHVDTAEIYQNEEGVGAGLRDGMKALGLARNDVFVTTKLFPGNAAWGQTPKTTETTIASLETSLKNLGLDYVDLYLIHAPFQKDQRIAQWRGLMQLQQRGKARAIGVSNFNQRHIEELVEAGLPLPAADQIELHPWSQKPSLVRFLNEKGITPIAYSSLVPLSTWRTAPGHDSGKTDAMRAESARDNSTFKIMAAKYGVSEARLLLRWAVQQGWPVLPKSVKKERIVDNADLFSFVIDDADMKSIAALDRGDGVAWGANDPTRNP